MNTTSILAGLVFFLAVYLIIRFSWKPARKKTDDEQQAWLRHVVPVIPVPNDKLILAKGVSYDELKQAVSDLCKTYNEDGLQVICRLTKHSENLSVVTFPFDIDFEIFCYVVNYLVYPEELNHKPSITAWTRTSIDDTWITDRAANKQVMLFVPEDDTEHDNVYLTTEDGIGYKLGFSATEESKLLTHPKKDYAAPGIAPEEWEHLPYEDIR